MNDLIIYETPQTKNRCYIRAAPAKHVGVLVHSTGAINRELRRYVDAESVLGKNLYNNHWNNPNTDKCMHAFIGYDKNGAVAVAHTLPYDYACWGCGKGANGSYNYDPTAHIQFEICQGSNSDTEYFKEAISAAELYCASLCRQYGWTSQNIVSHREAAQAGFASNHGDPESWMKFFGDDMNAFRKRVQALLDGEPVPGTPTDAHIATPPDTPFEVQIDTPPTPEPLHPVIVRGSSGEAVQRMQTLLISHGFELKRYGTDGAFGAETDAAVRAFQRASDLPADGLCDEDTWNALEADAVLYDVTIKHVSLGTAWTLCKQYPSGLFQPCAESQNA